MSQEDPGSTAGSRAPRIGRRIATGIFWLAALYMTAVGFYSVLPQVFSPDGAAASEHTQCAPGIRALRAELLAEASERVASGGTAPDDELRRFFSDWDSRYVALGPVCDGPRKDAYRALGRLRHRLDSKLRSFDRELGPLHRAVDSELSHGQ